jgi:protein-tyrosine phosphatase
LGVRTSKSHPLYVDWLDPPARVGMTLAPGVRDISTFGFRWERDLDADIDAICNSGATALVCLLEDSELSRYGILELLPKARARGLEVLRLAIPDAGVPLGFAEVDELLDAMEAHEATGGRLVVHCRGGLGRTGTIAGCYLVRKGVSYDETLAMLRRVRKSDKCPETTTQRSFIARYADHVRLRASREPEMQAAASTDISSWFPTAFGGYAALEQATGSGPGKSYVESQLEQIEREVAESPERSFSFGTDGNATLSAAGRTFCAGAFSTPTLGELRTRAAQHHHGSKGRLVLSVVHGAHPFADIGTLQATAPLGTLFQVASQFNCLEAPGAHLVPISDYVHDPTQGPRAAVSAFPGTFLRHYRAPDANGSRFMQTEAHCLNLLADVFDDRVASVRSGYLQTSHVRDMAALAGALTERFDRIRVGMHAGVDVVFGYDWGGAVAKMPQRISQVLTSTMALGGYSHDDGATHGATARRQLLRAAYLGTLLAGVDLQSEGVVLTLIGGGAFGNPLRDIWDAIYWALAEAEPYVNGTKHVIVNAHSQSPDLGARATVRSRGGDVFALDRTIRTTRMTPSSTNRSQ